MLLALDSFPRLKRTYACCALSLLSIYLSLSLSRHFAVSLAETPYDGGSFHIKLVLSNDFPHSPPRGFFLTKIYHPNVASNGDICVNTLKRDWTAEVTISHVLQVRRRLSRAPLGKHFFVFVFVLYVN